MAETPGACPSEEELAELVERGLSAAVSGVEVHLARCETCRRVLAQALAKTRSGKVTSSAGVVVLTEGATLPSGGLVGRYRILELLGSGAMGSVYTALDPELDRRVAVKVLRSDAAHGTEELGQRLRREAKAMAKLSHPNVVTVFDVGTSDGRVFLAMELVEGITLRDWLAAAPRSSRAIVEVFVLAGRGLAAAHAAGLVHRDFKPDNVLVTPAGAVRVTDFGLARAELWDAPVSSRAENALEPVRAESHLTRTGTLLGTPAYMAPEQLDRSATDARSDLFSFCVALWEALYGERPFRGETFGQLRESIRRGLVAPEASSIVPRATREALQIGLRDAPAERYPAMTPLLDALAASVAVRASKRPRALAWTAALVVGTATFTGVWLRARRAEALACEAAGDRAGAIWNDGSRRAVHETFLATKRPYAEDTFARTASVLDAYTKSWQERTVATCNAAKRAPSDPLAGARATCMNQRVTELRAYVDVLRYADAEALNRAVSAARALVGVDVCAESDPLQGQQWPGDPAALEEARALRDKMAVTAALQAAGRYREGLAQAEQNAAQAEQLAFQPLVAEALLPLGELQERAGSAIDSERSLRRAVVAAERSGAARVAVRAWLGIALRVVERRERAPVTDALEHAGAWLDRVGGDALFRGRALAVWAKTLVELQDYDGGRALAEKAVALLEPTGDGAMADALTVEAVSDDLQDRKPEARVLYQRIIALRETTLGPDNPSIMAALTDLGQSLDDDARYDEAVPPIQRALAIAERSAGPASPAAIAARTALADVYAHAGRSAEALPLAAQAVEDARRVYALGSTDEVYALKPLCWALLDLHRPAEAIEPAERELAIRSQAPDQEAELADAKCDLGLALTLSGRDTKRGRELLREARDKKVELGGDTRRLPGVEEALAASAKAGVKR
jgi:serine/threonine-protein kinase